LKCKLVLPGGSGTTIRGNTQQIQNKNKTLKTVKYSKGSGDGVQHSVLVDFVI
jgi:hypothetical protein